MNQLRRSVLSVPFLAGAQVSVSFVHTLGPANVLSQRLSLLVLTRCSLTAPWRRTCWYVSWAESSGELRSIFMAANCVGFH